MKKKNCSFVYFLISLNGRNRYWMDLILADGLTGGKLQAIQCDFASSKRLLEGTFHSRKIPLNYYIPIGKFEGMADETNPDRSNCKALFLRV